MFVLIGVRDTVPVAPKTFDIPAAVTIQDALNKKYANKLIPGKGLALSVYDILTAEDGKVTWGNGMMYYKVSFRLMLFAPFASEVLVGKILSTTKSYVRISIGFFQDIYVLASALPPNSAYDPQQKQFFWVSTEDETPLTPEQLANTVLADRLWFDDGEIIRFRVDNIEWQDVRPPPVNVLAEETNDGAGAEPEKDPIEKAGFKVMGSVAESGLGVISWWAGQGEGEGEEGMEYEE